MNLGLVFSPGVSLQEWKDKGLYGRELDIYRELYSRGKLKKLYLFTFGSNDSISDGLDCQFISVVQMPKLFNNKLFRRIYILAMPFIAKKQFREVDCIKTNQLNGAITALIASILYKKIFYYRCGYSFLDFAVRARKPFLYLFLWRTVEKIVLRRAHFVSMSSSLDITRANSIEKRIYNRLPNFINLEKFVFQTPKNNDSTKSNAEIKRLVFVGRYSEQKNIQNLLKAIENLKCTLDIYGSGFDGANFYLKKNVRNKIRILKPVSNDELPIILKKYDFFILPSLYEGTPKVLLEAMAIGLPCIGTKVDGIQELLQDSRGFLADSVSSRMIYSAISIAIDANQGDLVNIVQAARMYIEINHSLSRVADEEQEIYIQASAKAVRIT